jgi:hypothetical protein
VTASTLVHCEGHLMQRMFTELVVQTGVSKRELMLDISSAT